MLVLSRRINERLMIGDEVSIKIISIIGGQVRLGIDAPRDISIHRQEVYDRIHGITESDADNTRQQYWQSTTTRR